MSTVTATNTNASLWTPDKLENLSFVTVAVTTTALAFVIFGFSLTPIAIGSSFIAAYLYRDQMRPLFTVVGYIAFPLRNALLPFVGIYGGFIGAAVAGAWALATDSANQYKSWHAHSALAQEVTEQNGLIRQLRQEVARLLQKFSEVTRGTEEAKSRLTATAGWIDGHELTVGELLQELSNLSSKITAHLDVIADIDKPKAELLAKQVEQSMKIQEQSALLSRLEATLNETLESMKENQEARRGLLAIQNELVSRERYLLQTLGASLL